MTEEQLIVLGFLAAAFVVGWLARALIGRRERRSTGAGSPAVISQENLRQAVEATRKELDRAIRSHVAAVALAEHSRGGAVEPARAESPEPTSSRPGHPRPTSLAEQVSAALQDDAANECMLSATNAGRAAELSERELDLTDWGFAYGVAWARAQEQRAHATEDAVAREALRAAEGVFRAYTAEADWSGRAPADGNGRTGRPHPAD